MTTVLPSTTERALAEPAADPSASGRHAADLHAVLALDPAAVEADLRSRFDALAAGRTAIVLAGASHLGRRTQRELHRLGVTPVAFVDNDPARHGTTLDGVPVLSVADGVARYAGEAVFVVTAFHTTALGAQLAQAGVTVAPWTWLWWRHADAMLPYGGVSSPSVVRDARDDVLAAYALLADDASRDEYIAQLRYRTDLDSAALAPARPEADTYFEPGLVTLHDHEVFCDCGAFDGDSWAAFRSRVAGRLAGAVLIEPNPASVAAIQQGLAAMPAAEAAKVTVFAAALGDRESRMQLDIAGPASAVGGTAGHAATSVEVAVLPLDTILGAGVRGGTVPTLVKMDLEGAEPEAVTGAARTLALGVTRWAITLYHEPDHLWSIPLLVERLAPGKYTHHLRRYAEDCWELVYYALPRAAGVLTQHSA